MNLDNEYFHSTLVNINGLILKPEHAVISIFDRGFLYGDSVYEVTRSYDGKIFFLDEHLDRLFNSMEILSLKTNWTKTQINQQVLMTFEQLKEPNAYIRIMITRGISKMGLDTDHCSQSALVIIVKKFQSISSEFYTKGYHYIIAKTLRVSPKALNPNAKSGNYLNSILALIEAKHHGAHDAILLNERGEVTEGTTNNIWIVKNKIIYTAPVNLGILKGITRDIVLSLCHELKIIVQEVAFYKEDLFTADEVFMTSSTKEIVPITMIDHRKIQNGIVGDVTSQLMKEYKKFVQRKLS